MSRMSSRERVHATLNNKIPDRVAVMEMFIDNAVIDSISPGMCYEDFIDYADMDVVTCLTMAESPEKIDWVDKDRGLWKDKWGAFQQLTEETISIVCGPAVIEDETDLANYTPPDPKDANVLEYARDLVARFKGKRAIAVVGEESFAPVMNMCAGFESMFINYCQRPDMIKKMAAMAVDYHIELYRMLLKEGVEIVILGDDYAGKNGIFMSPAHFNEFIYPGMKKLVGEVKAAGGYVIKHCDGDFWPIMDAMVSTGIDMLGPLEPAYMQLEKVRKHSNNSVGVVGNVDVDLLSIGTTEQIKEATLSLLKNVSPLGGHIISSGNTISSSVKGENFMTMINTVKEYGYY